MTNCKLCGKPFQYINLAHTWFKHHMSQRAYKRRYGGPLKSEEYKAVVYKNHSELMSWWRRNGTITPPPPTEEARQNSSKRMKEDNPMFYPDVVKKVQEAKRGKPSDPVINNLDLKGFEEAFKEADKRFERKCADCGMTEETHIMLKNQGLYAHDIPYPQPSDNPFINQFLLCTKCHVHEMMRLSTIKVKRRHKPKWKPIHYIV